MKYYAIMPALVLSACNYMHVKPDTMEKDVVVFADRGGYSMRRAIKEVLEERGYKVSVGTAKSSSFGTDNSGNDFEIDRTAVPANARYAITVKERSEIFMPIWCFFNGYWWWRFNVSIADQKTGEELLAWSGRGCADSSLRKLDGVLDKLEK